MSLNFTQTDVDLHNERIAKNRGVSQSPVTEPIVRSGVLATQQGAKTNGTRFSISITSFRTRLCDPDNLCGKHFVDCLRYSGLIPDDTAAFVDYSIRQEKVAKKEDEKTEIIITKL